MSPQLLSRLPHLLRHTNKKRKPWTLIEELVTATALLISCLPPASLPPWLASRGLWTEGHVGCTVSFYFFPLPSPQWTMTLKSNKNEPAATLESVNSVRTALSDLYLEQLIQNKPKSDKVPCLFPPPSSSSTHFLCLWNNVHYAMYLLACFRDSAMRHMTVVCFATGSLKIDFASVFVGNSRCSWNVRKPPRN